MVRLVRHPVLTVATRCPWEAQKRDLSAIALSLMELEMAQNVDVAWANYIFPPDSFMQ